MKFLEKTWKEKEFAFFVLKTKEGLWIQHEGQTHFWKYQAKQSSYKKITKKQKELIQAPLPGLIQKLFVKEKETVKKGQNLLTLSAMKMEYSFKAESDGVVESLFCKPGDNVSLNENLIKLKYKNQKI